MQIPMILNDSFQTLRLVVSESLVGGAVIVCCVVMGWHVGRDRQARFVGLISWWLDHVVRPLIVKSSWLRRLAIIAVNNSLVCASMVLLGAIGDLSWLGVAFVGLGLGVAIRLLIGEEYTVHDEDNVDVEVDVLQENGLEDDESEPELGWPAIIGLTLNLLEIPAIMFSAGLSLGQGSFSSVVNLSEALSAYLSIVCPMLVIAAAGEALWMTMDPHLSEKMRSGGV